MISILLGTQQDLVRRIGGLCLLVMGVHASADVLDDLAYDALDALDFAVDDAAASFLSWLSARGGLTPDGAVRAIEGFAGAIDLAEKDWLAVRLALLVELVLDLLLLELAWGTRDLDGGSLVDDLTKTTRQLIASFAALDLERLLAPFVLTGFVAGGAVLAALSLEQLTRALLERLAPELLIAGNVAAAFALIAIALLLWRFLPDLLHGAVVRAHARGERARAALTARRAASTKERPPRFPRVGPVVDEVRRVTRGLWLLFPVFVAGAGLFGADLAALLERLGAAP